MSDEHANSRSFLRRIDAARTRCFRTGRAASTHLVSAERATSMVANSDWPNEPNPESPTWPPNTPHTAAMRELWQVSQKFGGESLTFVEWYENSCREFGRSVTPNGIAIAQAAFDRAMNHWPNFHRPTDTLAVIVWAEMFDTYTPCATPEVAAQAVDLVAATKGQDMQPGYVLRAIEHLMGWCE